jgi:hypothetical protein
MSRSAKEWKAWLGRLPRDQVMCDMLSDLSAVEAERNTWRDGFNKVEAERDLANSELKIVRENLEAAERELAGPVAKLLRILMPPSHPSRRSP